MNLFKIYSVLIFTLFITACTSSALFVVNNLARFGDYTVASNIKYGDETKQNLNVYIPENLSALDKQDIVTVVFFYGGCWGACSELTKEDYRFVAQAFTANNIIAVLVDYRQFPNVIFPAIMNDAKLSMEWVSTNIDSYGGNKHNIFLMGHSAGAHIASMLVFNDNYLKPSSYKNIKGFIGLAGPYDFLPFDEWYQPELFAPPKTYSDSQTINFVDGNEAPALLLYGNEDTRVKRRNIVSLTNVINQKNGKVDALYYDDIDHAGLIGALSIPLRSSNSVMTDILTFITATMKK